MIAWGAFYSPPAEGPVVYFLSLGTKVQRVGSFVELPGSYCGLRVRSLYIAPSYRLFIRDHVLVGACTLIVVARVIHCRCGTIDRRRHVGMLWNMSDGS
jgi:hypothetical protein